MNSITSIKRTADDSSISKLSAANLGYFEDEFLQYFAVRSIKKPPIINKGVLNSSSCYLSSIYK